MAYFAATYEAGGPAEPLGDSGVYLNLFPDLAFEYDGYVTQWIYYANILGDFFADVWRPIAVGSKTYRLVSKDHVIATSVGISVKCKFLYIYRRLSVS